MKNRILVFLHKTHKQAFTIIALICILSPQLLFANKPLIISDSLSSKHKISFSQGTDVTLIAASIERDHLLYGNVLNGRNIDFAVNYNYIRKSGQEIILNLVYTFDKDSYTFYNHYLDEYGSNNIVANAHLISLEIGNKSYSKKVLTRLNFYSTISLSVSFSLYRKNDIYMPGLDHYQEYKGILYSHANFLFGKGIELPTYKNQYFMAEAGFDIPLPLNNHSNLVYSLDFYFKLGYGFTF